MQCQNLLSGKNEKKNINMSSAGSTQRVIKVNSGHYVPRCPVAARWVLSIGTTSSQDLLIFLIPSKQLELFIIFPIFFSFLLLFLHSKSLMKVTTISGVFLFVFFADLFVFFRLFFSNYTLLMISQNHTMKVKKKKKKNAFYLEKVFFRKKKQQKN